MDCGHHWSADREVAADDDVADECDMRRRDDDDQSM